uniref:DUF1394 domain-containing protein n=1 Tax=Macrostomum lignano TaxID=282301 RepID=A0A1I8IJR8_9PLAT
MSAAQSDGQVTIVDAIRNVDLLDNLDTSDDVYNIEAAPVSLLLKHDADRNFQDRSAYVVGVAKYMEEAASHAEMTELLKEGEEYAVMLYTWRSCSRALPQIRSNEQSNKGEIHERTVEVLQPYAVKLMNFMLFQDVRRLCLNMRKQDFVSEAYLLTMGSPTKCAARRPEPDNVDSIFKQCQVVNLYGDMSISPFDAYVAKRRLLRAVPLAGVSQRSRLRPGRANRRSARIRQEYDASLMSELAKRTNLNTTVEQGSTRSDADNRKLYDLALKALCRLGGWNLQVLDAFTWKLANLSDLRQNPDMPKDAEDYAKAVQYNYTSAEKFALVELVSNGKLFCCGWSLFSLMLSSGLYTDSYRRRREVVRSILLVAIRTMAADRFEADIAARGAPSGVSTKTAKRSIRDDSASQQADDIRMEQRPVAPNSTQLYMVRTMLESLAGRGNSHHTLRKDVDPQLLRAIEEFNSDSFFWPYLLNYTDSLQQCCDLSQLWYREFYLEMTNGARIQFDIDMSMPWLLTKHLLESRSPAFMEFLLYPMDLYNDSAFFALTRFKRQFLYDEIEAEANLAFDQLVICLSDHIFSYYKNLAASIHMDEAFRSEANARGARLPLPPPVRYSVLIGQRHVSLLGRSIDLNSLETAVRLFESRDITGILELDCLVGLARLTHRLLSEAGLSLDDFDSLLSEANEEVELRLRQDLRWHIFWELQLDFVPQYCYNSSTNRFCQNHPINATETNGCRFPRTMPREDLLFGSSRLNKALQLYTGALQRLCGSAAFAAMWPLLGYSGIGTVVNEMLKAMRGLLEGTMAGYVTDLRQLDGRTSASCTDSNTPARAFWLKPIIHLSGFALPSAAKLSRVRQQPAGYTHAWSKSHHRGVNDLKHAAAF